MSTALTIVKTMLFTLMPRASVSIAITVTPGSVASIRIPNRTSLKNPIPDSCLFVGKHEIERNWRDQQQRSERAYQYACPRQVGKADEQLADRRQYCDDERDERSQYRGGCEGMRNRDGALGNPSCFLLSTQ